MIELYGRTTPNLTLAEGINACLKALDQGIALLYSPRSCQFGKLDSAGNIYDSQNQIIDLNYENSYIFEARIFNPNYELRWLNEDNGKGQVVLISEQNISEYLGKDIETLLALEIIPQQYLLWGEKTDTQLNSGWQRLATARIGSLDIPINQSLTKEQRVYLKTCEYLATVDEYSNSAVVEERLLNLEVA